MDMLSGIEPGNIYELNEKKVLNIFLHTIMLETRPDSSELQELLTIGNQCIYEGGPAVDDARHMYTGFTGVELPEVECERLAEREGRSQQEFSVQAGFAVYPNPANDYLIVQISATAFKEVDNYQLIISNSLGQPTLQAQVKTPESRLSIGKLPVGAYHIRLENAGKVVFAQPLVINR